MYRTGIYVLRGGRWQAFMGRKFGKLEDARAACLSMVDEVMNRRGELFATECVAYVLDRWGFVRHERLSLRP